MKLKSFFLFFAAAAIISSVGLLSCKTLPDGSTDTILASELANFIVVRGDSSSQTETDAAIRLRRVINETYDISVSIATDWDGDDDNSARKEILVGRTNRPQSVAAHEGLDQNTFSIIYDGTKIAVAAGSDYALDCAVDYFIKNFIGGAGILLAADMNLKLSVTEAGYADASANKIAVYQNGDGPQYSASVKTAIENAGYSVTVFDFDTKPSEVFDAAKFDLVLICGASEVPTGTPSAACKYLEGGGKLLALGGPVFEKILYKIGDKFMTRTEYLADFASKVEDKSLLIDFTAKNALRKLTRTTNDFSSPQITELGDFGRGNSTTLKVFVENLTSWDLVTSKCSVPSHHDAVAFWAKGDSATPGLYIEFTEKDGSRWYATVELTDEWQYYVVPESQFKIWESPFRAGTSFDLSNAVSCGAGFAMSGQVIPAGTHTFYLDDFATINNTLTELSADAEVSIDGFSPLYELYPITVGANVKAHDNQIFVADTDYVLPSSMFSCSPGRQAIGFDTGRVSRFIPLLEVTDSKGLHSGYLAWVYRFTSTTDINGAREGSGAGVISTDDPAFYNEAGLSVVLGATRALLADSYIVEGGTDEFIYIKPDNPDITYGMVAAAADEEDTELRVTLYSGDTEVVHLSTPAAEAKDNNTFRKTGYYSAKSTFSASDADIDRAVAELFVAGGCVDRVEHAVKIWSPKPESERKYIYTENGAFMRDGEVINFFGVNYMPSYDIAEPNGALFEHYVSRASYDPTVVYNDLLRVKDIGMNSVSVFVYYETIKDSNNILHLIDMCESLGLYVDLSIRPYAYPMNFNENEVKTLIEKCHFPEVDNIIAYDIAWEPLIRTYDHIRYKWDGEWMKWIQEQYGSVDAALRAWKCGPIERDASGNIVVTDEMLGGNAPAKYNLMVAAYRRFTDDYVSKVFAEKTEYIRDLDKNHLISFRMSNSGSAVAVDWSGYDFQSLAPSLDFMSPEGYALRASSDSCLQLVFAAAYARYTKPGAPVMLKEYGKHVWSGSNFGDISLQLAEQKNYYEHVLQKAYAAHISALYCWFFPGGYRINENSDYGIFNPDGSDRPVTALLREYAPKFLALGTPPAEGEVISIERSDYPAGITGMFNAVFSRLDAADKAGKHVIFTDSNGLQPAFADELADIAVGGYRLEDGETAPLQHVNGQVMRLELADGKRVYSGESLPAGGTLTITVMNTGHSTWRAGTLIVFSEGEVAFEAVVDTDIPYLCTAEITVKYDGSGVPSIRFKIGERVFGYAF